MTTTRPTKCVMPGQIGKILGFEDYYFESKCILCTQAFSVATISTTANNDESHPCKTNNGEFHPCTINNGEFHPCTTNNGESDSDSSSKQSSYSTISESTTRTKKKRRAQVKNKSAKGMQPGRSIMNTTKGDTREGLIISNAKEKTRL